MALREPFAGLGPVARTAVAPALFGTTYLVANSSLLPQGRPLLLGTLRVAPAALVLLVFVRPRLSLYEWTAAALIGVFGMGVFMGAFFVAADRLPSGIAATVANTTPLFALVLSRVVLGEHVGGRRLLAAGAAITGIALLVGASARGLSVSGVICGAISAGLLAAGFVSTKRWLPHVPALHVTAVQLTSGALVLALAAATLERGPVQVTDRLAVGTLILSVPLTAIPYVLLFAGIRSIGPARVALLAPITPIVAALLGFAFRGESLTALQWLGLMTVLVALVAAQQGVKSRGEPVAV